MKTWKKFTAARKLTKVLKSSQKGHLLVNINTITNNLKYFTYTCICIADSTNQLRSVTSIHLILNIWFRSWVAYPDDVYTNTMESLRRIRLRNDSDLPEAIRSNIVQRLTHLAIEHWSALKCKQLILYGIYQYTEINSRPHISLFQRPATSSGAAMSMRMQGASGMHPYGPNVPRAGLVPGAAAAIEQARRRQDAKNRRRFERDFLVTVFL